MAPKKARIYPISAEKNEVFELTPVSTNLNPYYEEVKVEFCRGLAKSKSLRSHEIKRWPTFNTDGLYYTPAFIIPEDSAVLSLVRNCLKDEHLKKMKVNAEPSTKASLASFDLPHPEEQSYCGVCKACYTDFEEVKRK